MLNHAKLPFFDAAGLEPSKQLWSGGLNWGLAQVHIYKLTLLQYLIDKIRVLFWHQQPLRGLNSLKNGRKPSLPQGLVIHKDAPQLSIMGANHGS